MAKTETQDSDAESTESADEVEKGAEAAGAEASDGADGVPPRTTAPYRVEAVPDDGKWHVTVQSLHDHPDRGEVDAVVVTVTPDRPAAGFPAAELDRTLRRCGFTRDGDWAQDGERWSTPCRQADPQAAPPNTPPREG
ncbi:hypothetical protein [Streptomyces sp. NBC_01198]|uniref:hypothetical protein n=1 Tax=Streptomyces sp. NBC_01198 TaxID=2903769 RepID=UPI002E161075|nr:hypothetical protein OG702_21005 [Streptomyces sp. NBC_01198]